jgi:hypothetical protein
MKTKLWFAMTFGLVLFPVLSMAQSGAVVVVTDDGGIGEPSARTARHLLINSLRSQNVLLVDRPELDRVLPMDDALKSLIQGTGASKIYALRLSALGGKLIAELQELGPGLEFLGSQSLSAKGAEELDVVLPRLVKAIVSSQPVEQTAEIDNLAAQEGRKWEKKPGEFFWGLGIMGGTGLTEGSVGTFGFDLRFAYEMEQFRINTNLGGMFTSPDSGGDDGSFRISVGGSYLFSKSSFSPYVGMDFGYMINKASRYYGMGVGVIPHVGIELFRLHKARMMIEVGCMLPFFKSENHNDSDGEEPASGSRYVPTFFGMVSAVW